MSPSIWQAGIVLIIILLIFGTKKLRNIGSDLGGGVSGFKKALREGEDKAKEDKVLNTTIVEDEKKESDKV